MSDREPESYGSDESPMWESDVEEREARRRRMLVFGGAGVAVLLGFVGLYAALSWIAGGLTNDPTLATERNDGGTTIAFAEPGEADPTAPLIAPAQPVLAGELDWYAIESPLGFSTRMLAGDSGAFYALSTVPGNAAAWPVRKAIYKSNDGENWDIIDLDDTMSGHDMAIKGSSIYLIGTSPANQSFQEPPEVLISTSRDDGATWTQSLLPTVSEPPGGAPVDWANVQMRIGASADTIVAVVNSQFNLDFRALVPGEFVGNDVGYSPRAEGVDVIDYRLLEQLYIGCENEASLAADPTEMSPECEALFNGDESAASVGFVTWDEMNLPDGGQPVFAEMFVSSDGESFESVESPLAPGGDLSAFHASDSGFVAVEWDRGSQRVWWSPDGRDWVEDEGLDNLDWVVNIGSVGDRTVILGQAQQSSIAAWQNQAGGWDIVNFNDVLGAAPPEEGGGRWLTSGAVGPLGVVAVFQSFDEVTGTETAEIVVGSSPDDWSLMPIDEITGMSGGYSDWVAVGSDQILIRYEVHGRFQPRSLQVIGTVTDA